MAADRQHVGAERTEVDRYPPCGLRGVDVDEHTSLAAAFDDLDDRLGGADLVVPPLEVDHRSLVVDHRQHVVRGHAPAAIDADGPHLAVHRCREAHGRVLDGGHDLVATPVGGAPTGGGDRLGRAGGEDDLAGSGTEERGDACPSVLEHRARGHALVVDP